MWVVIRQKQQSGNSKSDGFPKLTLSDRESFAIIVLGHEPVAPREDANVQIALSNIVKALIERAFFGGEVLFQCTSCMLLSQQR